MTVPTNIQIPVSAPYDIQGVSQLFVTISIALNLWIGAASQFINGFGGYTFTTDASGNLVAIGPGGTQTIVAAP